MSHTGCPVTRVTPVDEAGAPLAIPTARSHSTIRYLLGVKGPSKFGSSSTAEQVSAGWSGEGKVAIITGCATGLGLEALRVLTLRGCEVFAGVRTPANLEAAVAPFRKANPAAKITVLPLDLSSLASVRDFAAAFQKQRQGLNILMLNAGIMATPFGLSKDGHEMQFATNHLGHFLLSQLLIPQLEYAATQAGAPEGRIIVTSSALHSSTYKENVRLDAIDSPVGYDSMKAYGQSKLCNILFGREMARRLTGKRIAIASLHPGVIFSTALSRDMMPPAVAKVMYFATRPFLKSIPKGAATQVWCAVTPTISSGAYYSDSNLTTSSAAAKDDALALRLWELSEKMTAL